MAKLRKQTIEGMILLEGLLAVAVFAMITTLLLGQIKSSRALERERLQQEEVLLVAQMALQTKQDELALNGIEVHVKKEHKKLGVYHENKEVLYAEKD